MMASVAVESVASVSKGGDGVHRTSSKSHKKTSVPSTPVHPSVSIHMEAEAQEEQPIEWGRNFWVTLVDPQVR